MLTLYGYVGRFPLFEHLIKASLVFYKKAIGAIGAIEGVLYKLLEPLRSDNALDQNYFIDAKPSDNDLAGDGLYISGGE